MHRGSALQRFGRYFTRPVQVLKGVRRTSLRFDAVAGLTVAVVAVPQSIAYAAIAGLPPEVGLYAACVASVVGALWGSSRHLSSGPTNASSLLVLSVLAPLFAVGSPEFVIAAGAMAVLAGLCRIVFAFAGLGVLVNFASRAVLMGFTAGAAILIAVGQLKTLLRLDVPRTSHLHHTVLGVASQVGETHLPSLAIGVGTLVVVAVLQRAARRVPGPLVALIAAGTMTAALGADRVGVAVVGEVPRALPGLTDLRVPWLLDGEIFGALLAGAMAVAALGLAEAISIAREIARQSGDRIDINQELVGQGVANVATGLLGGYPSSGSFTRSAVNFQAGARTHLAGVLCGLFVLAAIFAFGPLAAFLPQASLAGLVLLIAARMPDWDGMKRVLHTSRTETGIMAVTFVATLTLPLEFAILCGIIMSLTIYIYQSSMPTVHPVVPDDTFRHFVERPGEPQCPQLAVVNIRGALFFGAVAHVEDALLENLEDNPGQHFLLLRMHGVSHCDLSGIDALEGIVRLYRDTGGDVYVVQAREPVRELMQASGFELLLGADHFLEQENAIDFLFEQVIDPGVCCYECEHRVFAECQPLHKHHYDARLPTYSGPVSHPDRHLNVREFEDAIASTGGQALIVDVREPEEYHAGRVPGASLVPLRSFIERAHDLPHDRPIYLVCRSGRRSTRALHWLMEMGFDRVYNLKGGILSWKALGRPVEVD